MDPLACTAEDAVKIIEEKRQSEEKSLLKTFTENAEITVREGRFGPYIKHPEGNAKIPKGTDPLSLSYEDCLRLIEETPAKGTARKGGARKSATSSARTKRTKKA